MALAAVTDHGDRQIFQEFGIAVFVVVHLAHFLFPFDFERYLGKVSFYCPELLRRATLFTSKSFRS